MNTQTQICHQRLKKTVSSLSITNWVQNIMNTQTHHQIKNVFLMKI